MLAPLWVHTWPGSRASAPPTAQPQGPCALPQKPSGSLQDTGPPTSLPTQQFWEAACMRPGAFSGHGCGPLLSSWTSPQRGQPWLHSQDAGAACVWVLAECLGCRLSRAGKESSGPLHRGNLS